MEDIHTELQSEHTCRMGFYRLAEVGSLPAPEALELAGNV
jgi:hypothetical protein